MVVMSRVFQVLYLSFISLNVGMAAELYGANVSFSYVEGGKAGTVWDYGIYLKRGPEVSIQSERVDVSINNLDSENCNPDESCPRESNKTVSYAILCSRTHLTDLLEKCPRYQIIIVCMDEFRLDALITKDPTFRALQATPMPSTIVALNQSDPDRLCALYRHDTSWQDDAVKSFRVTIKFEGRISIPKDPTMWPTDSTTSPLTFYFVMFAFCLLLMLAVIWFVFNYVKRCHQIVARRHQQVCFVLYPHCMCVLDMTNRACSGKPHIGDFWDQSKLSQL